MVSWRLQSSPVTHKAAHLLTALQCLKHDLASSASGCAKHRYGINNMRSPPPSGGGKWLRGGGTECCGAEDRRNAEAEQHVVEMLCGRGDLRASPKPGIFSVTPRLVLTRTAAIAAVAPTVLYGVTVDAARFGFRLGPRSLSVDAGCMCQTGPFFLFDAGITGPMVTARRLLRACCPRSRWRIQR